MRSNPGSLDKLRALQAFVAIVDRGSLTAAARSLGSSLPAVVRQLAALERQLGARLLNRTTRRQSLTEDGRLYLERARRLLADLDEADRLIAVKHAEPSGTLSITAPVLFGHMHVAPAVSRFLQRYPLTQVRLMLIDRVVDLIQEGHDLAVRIAHLPDSTLVAQSVGSVRGVVAASPGWLRRHGTPRHPGELARVNCLTGADSGQWAFVEVGRAFTVPVRGNFECNLAAPRLEACARGLGVGRFFSYQAAPYVRGRRLRVVLADFEEPPKSVSLVYPSARLLPLRTRVFIEFMKHELGQTLA
ncbi:MAG TPA: LysR substrate-binding domain-containing protein [Burkholderiaceae bacterium]|jgi:DNA-binding transcriptional LysR family regulator|nr:LysR substrate-binding domain-containing protein [Burkholderiaceae bacterium]